MNTFIFMDNQYDGNPLSNLYIIQSEGSKKYIEENFKKEYKKIMKEYRDDDTDNREYIDFYDELWKRLDKHNILLYTPDILDHNSVMKSK